jgi:hypothetical protein
MSLPGRPEIRVVPTLLRVGPERERVIRATFRQHPFPGNVLYRLAGGHIRDVGRFYRLEARGTDGDALTPVPTVVPDSGDNPAPEAISAA